MRLLIFLFILLTLNNCSSNKVSYWCGDHVCVNDKEKEEYFKKTMTVEIKDLRKDSSKDNTEIEKIILESQEKDKKRTKLEKNLSKLAKLEDKRKKKEEKFRAKKEIKDKKKADKLAKLNEKRRKKEEKKKLKQTNLDKANTNKKIKESNDMTSGLNASKIIPTSFSKLVKEIESKNILRPYPDINDIPN
tara:strand:- start:411 stop:980 length:570 start_codon:yes stop_codon:yes gene_type:complete